MVMTHTLAQNQDQRSVSLNRVALELALAVTSNVLTLSVSKAVSYRWLDTELRYLGIQIVRSRHLKSRDHGLTIVLCAIVARSVYRASRS